MPSLEIHPLSELRDEAAALLAERFAAQRKAEPLMPEVEDFAAQLPDDGHVATRGGEAVAYLGGAVEQESKLARWLFAGHAAREPEALRDLFALQAGRFGVSRFMLTVPATNRQLIDVWFRLAFGCQAVWAVQEAAPAEPVDFGGSIRPTTAEDVETICDFGDALAVHQQQTPSFSEFGPEPREEARAEFASWDDSHLPFLAEIGGRAVGLLVLYRRPEGDLRVPTGNIDLAFAAVRDEERGRGVGLALSNFALSWAHEHGFRSVTVDWRSVNLLSSRFWPRRGFRPQYLRLYRAVP